MKNQKGFTLMGVLVAMAIAIVGIALISPDLLSFFHKGRVAGAAEEYQAISDALRSAIMRNQGHIVDRTGVGTEGDLIDELIDMNYLDRYPQSIEGGTWSLKSVYDSSTEKTSYYIDIDCAGDANCIKVAEELDIRQDKGDGAEDGTVLWSNN